MSVSEALRVKAGSGSLEVRGVQGLREARVTGTACATNSRLLAELDISARREGGRILIETLFPEENWRNEQSRIDLVIEVPAGVAADISDGSGSLDVSGLGDLDLVDGSGEIEVNDIRGALNVEDGSGSIHIANVAGDVTIVDGSGEINVNDSGGSVKVSDGSGSINVRGVRGGFVVSSDGSGGVDWANVTGRVDVPARKRGR